MDFKVRRRHYLINSCFRDLNLRLDSFATKCDGVKCMSVISMSVCLYLVNGAKRCGGGRCGAMRSGAANTERSDDDLEEERGKHQRDPKVFTNQQTWHYLDQF